MTKEEILAMEAGSELDRLVAVEVMDLFCEYKPRYLAWSEEEFWYDMDGRPANVRGYSTYISNAWLVLKGFPGMKVTFLDTLQPSVIEGSPTLKKLTDGRLEWFVVQYEGYIVRAREAPEAICKAALLAKLKA